MNKPLTLWNDTATRQVILDFVASVTTSGSPDFVPQEERIAVFDNDGTLWCEKPMYIQLDNLLRKMAAQAERDPELRTKQPWKAAWEKDFNWLGAVVTRHYQGDDRDLKILLGGILSLSEGRPVEQVESEAREFIENEHHPILGRAYRECVYQPMLELLRYLEANGFSNYIASGGGRDFMRGFAQDLYGIPRQRVIGSTVAYHYQESQAGGQIVQRAEMDVIDDGPGKPVQIWHVIGRRPILAAGNSNGDLPMLNFAGGTSTPALRLLLLHDDAEREFDYIAGAEKALQVAKEQNWNVVSIQRDWQQVFPD